MKYLWIGLGLLCLMLAVSFVSLWLIGSRTAEICTQLEQAVEACSGQDYNKAFLHAEKANRLWEKDEPLFCAFLDHTETDDIKRCFSHIRSYMHSDTRHEFRADCAEALVMVRHLWETELPYLYNLL